MKVQFYTLGCKVNQQETGAIQRLFELAGHSEAAPGEKADIYLLNSCTVTAGGDKKSSQWLRKCKRENPDAITVLTGCMPQAFPEKAADIEMADVITGTGQRSEILTAVEEFARTGKRVQKVLPYTAKDEFEELPAGQPAGHTRAFLKVQDGCNRFCAYCIIPYARGRARSRNESSILAEVNTLAAAGYKEVVLTGINLTCYGDDSATGLAALVEKVAATPGIQRVRLGSLEPDLLSDETLLRLAGVKEFCPQFHLSLQSGCDATLKRMNRRYTTAFFEGLLSKMRTIFLGATFTTDVIVGFPGETEDEFSDTLAFVKRCRLLKVHVFSYSSRPGTAAAGFTAQVDETTKARRHKALQTAADEVRSEIIASFSGTQQEVLLEKTLTRGLYSGYTKGYIPVAVKAKAKSGDIVIVPLGPYDGTRCICVQPGSHN